ncbi:hypothetical protein QBC35DRAFT_522646 [Podospora australis]|uniref:Alpha-1,3/1,6-mannosyltransferase ALG2 n=1 Tax=Podospora australis TaxID=1536484 RepID=A0AAN7AK01_9PEZI|nr:hypothetical protein QBC35DRAFT_522646 [Podospora australis]
MAGDNKTKNQKTVVFLHPDLGIGGAERLVVDAAVGLQKRGHKVVIFTSHCDPAHCFDEARDGTLDVRVHGNTLIPSSILGRFSILCAILRQLHLILHITLFTSILRDVSPSAFFVDQLSAGLPLLKTLLPNIPIFFYCHFPDLLLVQNRQSSRLKQLYRIPFDVLEEFSMGYADSIAVNSGFTKGIVTKTWPNLAKRTDLKIVYPCIDTSVKKEGGQIEALPWSKPPGKILLSVNRFERKKDIGLAIRAFALLSPERRRHTKLLLAGGYDPRVQENVQYHQELVALCDELKLKNATTKTVVAAQSLGNVAGDTEVLFLLSVPNALKEVLLRSARLLVYTPSNEHFGIVPLEAMLRGKPVLAANNGGPTETVLEGETGWLRDPTDVKGWSEVMDTVLNGLGEEELERMGRRGKERVEGLFAESQMAERLEGIFEEMERGKVKGGISGLVLGMIGAVLVLGVAVGVVVLRRI